MGNKLKITDTAQTVLKKRYYKNNEKKFSHLAKNVATYFGKDESEIITFETAMNNGDFLPNSPALMNAGTGINSFSACFVLPVEDNINSIYKLYSDAAKISKSGGGVGANYSKIRGKNSIVNSTNGVASGPLSFMEVQDVSTANIKQGGKRRGANMGILNYDHPDILDFITCKENNKVLTNFNLSVMVDDSFMDSVINKTNPDNEKLWNLLCEKAWKSAEPGVLFGDRIERDNLVPHMYKLDATNPCGEQPLGPYESCSLGSINVGNFYNKETNDVDWDGLVQISKTATLFMNRILDKSIMPIPECQEALNKTRKIGVGIMGIHDLLIQMNVPYDSQEGRDVASNVMRIVSDSANEESQRLGDKEGYYDAYDESLKLPKRRNLNLTTIAPTGTLSMIADCASGCEPYYFVVTEKTVLDGTTFIMPNKWFVKALEEHPDVENSQSVIQAVKSAGKVCIPEVPKELQEVFKGAGEISPDGHVMMQAALQRYVDSSISKTINMPNSATIEDVKHVYELAYKSGCKGITVYRDGSRDEQVLAINTKKKGGKENGKKHLPNELDAKRYKIKGPDGNSTYIIICFDENEAPMEVFAKFPFENNIDLKDKSIMWATTNRLVSLALRFGIPIEEIIKQLDKSSGGMFDLPAQLSKLLKTFMSKTKIGYYKKCDDCGGKVVYTEGCEKCLSCGASKCG